MYFWVRLLKGNLYVDRYYLCEVENNLFEMEEKKLLKIIVNYLYRLIRIIKSI